MHTVFNHSRVLKTVLALLLVVVSNNAAAQSESTVVSEQTNKKLQEWNLNVKDGKAKSSGHYLHFVRQNGKWGLKSMSLSSPSVNDFDNEEVLVFSDDFKSAQPDFRDMRVNKPSEGFTCMTGVLRTKRDNARTDYNPCDSSLTSVQSLDLAKNVTLAVFSLGISAATGTTSRTVVVDPNKVVALLEESHAMDAIAADRRDKWLRIYRAKFMNIKTTRDIEQFVVLYNADDPDGLVLQAEAMKVEIAAREEEAKRNQELRRQEALRAQQLADEERERNRIESDKWRLAAEKKARADEAAANRRRDVLTAEFRRTIKIGSDTFCGPVINIRGPMIQIASSPYQGYTAEPWLKLSEIYPVSVAGCTNVNGRPVPIFH